ncbi:MAG TPA: hypothetical protein VFS39_05790 [Nitrospira sp.]|nr:hypothetical protein [Nitrospira sp.]
MTGLTRSAAWVLLLPLLIGCVPQLQATPRLQVDATESRCHPPPALGDSTRRQPLLRSIPTALSPPRSFIPLSSEALQTAGQIGLDDLLEAWAAAAADPDDQRRSYAMVSLRQDMTRRLALVSADVTSTIAAIDCEAARSDHVADALAEAHQDISERALFAVFTSDIFIGIIPGALMLAGHHVAAEANEVFGGIAGTAFGSVDALLHLDQEFRHPRNFLRELWEGPAESTLFPASVWRFLRDRAEVDRDRTVREVLLSRWLAEGRWDEPELKPDDGAAPNLLLTEGGRYGQRALRIRAQMLRQLGSEVLRLGLAVHRLKYELIQWLDAEQVVMLQNHDRNTGSIDVSLVSPERRHLPVRLLG